MFIKKRLLYLLNNKQSESGIDWNHKKFNPLRAKADSFGFRRGYFLKIKVYGISRS